MTDLETNTSADTRVPLEPLVRAFHVTYAGTIAGIYFATSASRAKVAALVDGNDAGYWVRFRDLRVRRAPEFDGATYQGAVPTKGIIPEFLDVS